MRLDAPANLLAALTLPILAILGEVLPIGGVTYFQATAGFAVMVLPAAFWRIAWWVAYGGVLVFGVYQASFRIRDEDVLDQGGVLFGAAFLAEAIRILAHHLRWYVLALAGSAGTVALLVIIYLRLGIATGVFGGKERWTVEAPVSLFLGLSCVQLVVSASTALYVYGWTAFGAADHAWAVVVIVILVALALLAILARRDYLAAGAVAWYLVTLLPAHPDRLPLVLAASLGLAVVIGTGTMIFVRRRLLEA